MYLFFLLFCKGGDCRAMYSRLSMRPALQAADSFANPVSYVISISSCIQSGHYELQLFRNPAASSHLRFHACAQRGFSRRVSSPFWPAGVNMARHAQLYAPGTAAACVVMAGNAQAAWGFGRGRCCVYALAAGLPTSPLRTDDLRTVSQRSRC